MNLVASILALHPDAVNGADFIVRDDTDGRGPYVASWGLACDPPTDEDLADAWEGIAASVAWDPIRAQRAPLLAEADIQLNKAEDQGKVALVAAIRTYRQALRDITQQADPASVVWPMAPW